MTDDDEMKATADLIRQAQTLPPLGPREMVRQALLWMHEAEAEVDRHPFPDPADLNAVIPEEAWAPREELMRRYNAYVALRDMLTEAGVYP